MSDDYEVHVLRQAACPDDETCFIAGTVAARPGKVQIVGKLVTDPSLRAAYAYKIGPDEDVFEIELTEWEGTP